MLVIPVEASEFHGGRLRNSGWRSLEGMGDAVDQRSCVCSAPTTTPAPKGPSGLIFHLGPIEKERPTNPILIEEEEMMVLFVWRRKERSGEIGLGEAQAGRGLSGVHGGTRVTSTSPSPGS